MSARIALKWGHKNSEGHSRMGDKLGKTTTINSYPSRSVIYSSTASRQVHFSTLDMRDEDLMYI
jgi:hypothetical protein